MAETAPTESRPSRLQNVLQTVLNIQPGEEGRTALFFVYLLTASSIFIIGRSVRDSLFLNQLPNAAALLPWMWVGYGVVSALVATVYSRFADRIRRDLLIIGFTTFSAVSYLAILVAIKMDIAKTVDWKWIYSVFFIWAEVIGNLIIVQCWTYANDVHTTRDAKRLFGVIGAGRVLGIVVCGIAIKAALSAALITTENLVFVILALMGGIVLCAALVRRWYARGAAPAPPRPRAAGQAPATREGSLLGTRYAQLFALTILLVFVACTVADYQFKIIAKDTFKKKEDLTAYFGLFYAVVGAIAFVLQFFCTSRILAAFGLLVGLAIMPISLLGSSVALLFSQSIYVASILKFSDNGFQYSINEASFQLLYFPFPEAVKGRIRALMDAIVKPVAYAVGGIVLIVAANAAFPQRLSLITIPLLLAWLVCIVFLRTEYVKALTRTLKDRRLRQGHMDGHEGESLTLQSLISLLDDENEETAVFALERIRDAGEETLIPHLDRLLASPHERIRIAAMGILERHPDPAHSLRIDAAMADRSPNLRAAALMAWCALKREDAIERVLPLREYPSPAVRAAAIAGLMKYGGLDGVMTCGTDLKHLLAGPTWEDRALAARILGIIGVRHFYRQLVPLLEDADSRVRVAAADAAGLIGNPNLIDPLLPLLGDVKAAPAAELALQRYGDEAIPRIVRVFDGNGESQTAAKHVARVLGRIGTPAALQTLFSRIDYPDPRVRRKILKAAARVYVGLDSPGSINADRVEERLLVEMRDFYALYRDWEAMQAAYPGELVESTFRSGEFRSLDRIYSLLRLHYPSRSIDLIRRNLRSGTAAQKSNALELADNTVGPRLKKPLLGLLEDSPIARKSAAGAELFELPTASADAWVEKALAGTDAWLRVVAMESIRVYKIGRLGLRVVPALEHPSALVRETAARTVAELQGPAAAEALMKLLEDRDRHVRTTVRSLLRDTGRTPAPEEKGGPLVLTTLERIVFLRHVTLLQGVPAEDLAALAEICEETFVAKDAEVVREGEPGDTLFVIVKGRVEVLVSGHRLTELGERDCFGEMSMLDQETRSATVKALEDLELLTIAQDDFHEMLTDRGEIASNILRVLTKRLRESDRQITKLRQRPAAEPPAAEAETGKAP
ncbi:MAG: HEAT repeat domain-containing protein [Planctomycetes bacterium]|nr:HEAT repeat domain-containing protein [Planctomycetota bacterium]